MRYLQERRDENNKKRKKEKKRKRKIGFEERKVLVKMKGNTFSWGIDRLVFKGLRRPFGDRESIFFFGKILSSVLRKK